MHDTMVVQISDGGEGCSNQISGIRLVVRPFSTDSIEKLAAECQVGYEVD